MAHLQVFCQLLEQNRCMLLIFNDGLQPFYFIAFDKIVLLYVHALYVI